MYKLNYHTGLLSRPSMKKVPAEKETILIRDYVGRKNIYHFLKRAFDICFSLLFLAAVLSWLIPLVSVLILFDSKGPVFFIQQRVGRNGRLFPCLKFRTMVINDEAHEKQAARDDRRVTRLGKFLRQTNIDEFPQFINILLGDMSIVGPRPHMLSDCTRFSFVIPAYKFRTLVRPGITGLAQVKGYHGPTLNYESIFMRYHWDAEYVRHADLWLDLRIVAFTFFHSLSNLIYSSGSLLNPAKN